MAVMGQLGNFCIAYMKEVVDWKHLRDVVRVTCLTIALVAGSTANVHIDARSTVGREPMASLAAVSLLSQRDHSSALSAEDCRIVSPDPKHQKHLRLVRWVAVLLPMVPAVPS